MFEAYRNGTSTGGPGSGGFKLSRHRPGSAFSSGRPGPFVPDSSGCAFRLAGEPLEAFETLSCMPGWTSQDPTPWHSVA